MKTCATEYQIILSHTYTTIDSVTYPRKWTHVIHTVVKDQTVFGS